MSQDEHEQDSPKTAHTSQTTDQSHQRDRSRVVVVYDDSDVGSILAHTLDRMGYQVKSVPYKRGTLRGLRERGYRLAVLEVKTVDAN